MNRSMILDFIKNINFRFIQPQMMEGKMDMQARLNFVIANTILPINEDKIRCNLISINDTPKMSTFVIGAIINYICSLLPNDLSYVNIGVWNGYSLLAGMSGNNDCKCIGVDNFSQFGGPRNEFLKRFNSIKSKSHTFFDMDYIDYFNNCHRGPIGLYFYDGDHNYSDQLNALLIAHQYLKKDSIIIVDDTNSSDPYLATLDFLKEHHKKYEIVLDRFTSYNGHSTFWNGILILIKS